MRKLVWLRVDDNPLTDAGARSIGTLDSLRTLSLTGTRISREGVLAMAGLQHLDNLYLYGTRVRGEDWPALQRAFPRTLLDSGGYSQAFIASDTMQVKPHK